MTEQPPSAGQGDEAAPQSEAAGGSAPREDAPTVVSEALVPAPEPESEPESGGGDAQAPTAIPPLTGTQPAPGLVPTADAAVTPPPEQPSPGLVPTADAAVTPPPEQPSPTPIDRATAFVDQRPEVAVGAAFAGGLVFAMILKRLAR